MEMKIPQDTTLLPGMKTVMADRSQKYHVHYMHDVEYVRRNGVPLKLQIVRPGSPEPADNAEKKYPLIVYVQGSAWRKQDCYHAVPMFAAIARKGYVIASVEYRASDDAPFPAFLQDVKSAIRFLRANADAYGIDPERVAIWGDSSGGNTALLAGVTGGMAEFITDDNRDVSDAVSSVVDYYGPTDVSKINDPPRDPMYAADKENIPEDILLRGVVAEHPDIARPLDPANYVSRDKEIPPIMIAHGDWDSMVPFQQSVLMYKKLVECGKVVEFYKVVGGEHGRFVWTEELLEITAKFIGAYL
jgi:acetyl esterase/lipase